MLKGRFQKKRTWLDVFGKAKKLYVRRQKKLVFCGKPKDTWLDDKMSKKKQEENEKIIWI